MKIIFVFNLFSIDNLYCHVFRYMSKSFTYWLVLQF